MRITFSEWLYLAKKYKRQILVVLASFVLFLVCGAAIVSHTFSSIRQCNVDMTDTTEIESLIYSIADGQGIKVYPYRINKIFRDISESGDYSQCNIEDIIAANLDEVKKIK